MVLGAGAQAVPVRAALGLAKELVGLYWGHSCDTQTKTIGAEAAAVLAGFHLGALEVVIEDARAYISLQRDVADADPFHPNSLDVLKSEKVLGNAIHRERVVAFLEDILKEQCGLAQGDMGEALLAARSYVRSSKIGAARNFHMREFGN
jgi:hypothetical protein